MSLGLQKFIPSEYFVIVPVEQRKVMHNNYAKAVNERTKAVDDNRHAASFMTDN